LGSLKQMVQGKLPSGLVKKFSFKFCKKFEDKVARLK